MNIRFLILLSSATFLLVGTAFAQKVPPGGYQNQTPGSVSEPFIKSDLIEPPTVETGAATPYAPETETLSIEDLGDMPKGGKEVPTDKKMAGTPAIQADASKAKTHSAKKHRDGKKKSVHAKKSKSKKAKSTDQTHRKADKKSKKHKKPAKGTAQTRK